MKVTVAITVLNEADTIKTLLSSLEAQTRQPDEVVVIDGASRDRLSGSRHAPWNSPGPPRGRSKNEK